MTSTLAQCQGCAERITPAHVEGVEQIKGGRVVVHWLHVCGSEGVRTMPLKAYEALANRWADRRAKAQLSYDTEKVGRQVQGFRIDLDVVETVADLEAVWGDQERHDRWSIPKEHAVR